MVGLGSLIKAGTKASRKYGKAKSDLSAKIRKGTATKEESKQLKALRERDIADTISSRIKSSQARRKKEVSLAGSPIKAKKDTRPAFDSKTGEILNEEKFNKLTPKQVESYVKNFITRKELSRSTSKMYGGKMVKKKEGGYMGGKAKKKASPKGIGCAKRGYGKAMKG